MMDIPDFSSCQNEDIIQFASEATPAEIEKAINLLSEKQASLLFSTINDHTDKNWRKKTQAAIIGLTSRTPIEKLGSVITLAQFFSLLDSCLQVENSHHWKISPLLVGMPHEMFIEVIETIEENQLQVFKDESVTEPIQHHLTTLAHHLENEIEEGEFRIDQLYERVDQFQVEDAGLYDVLEIIKEVELNLVFFERRYQISNKALAIAWNTNREDLIESLNSIKKSYHKFILYGLGSPRSDHQEPTGIFQLLEETLFAVYSNHSNLRNAAAVRESEPATEGLAMLSVWYLRDYWDLGLLPQVKDKTHLDLDLNKHSEIERVHYREELFSKVKENLALIGLSTVKDLKDRYIFSKKSLQEYIQENQKKLLNNKAFLKKS